jgi:hypothetical protein
VQGWGYDVSPNGYYPYWVYPDPQDPDRSIFAFYPRPEDVIDLGHGQEALQLGRRSLEVVQRWVPVLAQRRSDPGPADHS